MVNDGQCMVNIFLDKFTFLFSPSQQLELPNAMVATFQLESLLMVFMMVVNVNVNVNDMVASLWV